MDSSKSAAITAAIVALIVGGGVGYVVGNNNDSDSSDGDTMSKSESNGGTDTGAADLRVGLNAALREHVSLASIALRDVFDGAKSADAAVASLDENSVEVSKLVGSVYGQEAESQFLSLWRNHIGFFADYTVAAKAGDKAKMDQALADLAGYSTDAGAFFENANPNLPASVVMPMLKQHRDLVIAAVNAYGAGDYKESFAQESKAYDQIGTVADALAGGIYKQSPDKFTK